MLVNLAPPSLNDILMVWSPDQSPQHDPRRHGWRCAEAWKDGPFMIGRNGGPGCALIEGNDGAWDIAVYLDTPEETVETRGDREASHYRVRDFCGWGHNVIRLIEEEMAVLCV